MSAPISASITDTKKRDDYALITGASSGLGAEFAQATGRGGAQPHFGCSAGGSA
jgi:NAD(P)-dependent dehydrogenase (short-subunit alcohol dehydrogenase family)